MIAALFLSCALATPAVNFPHGKAATDVIVADQNPIHKEQEQLKEWLRKNNPDADVFITPPGQSERLKDYGLERVPFTHRGMEIWIRRKPKTDRTFKESA